MKMTKENQRDAILRVLDQRGDWVWRQALLAATGHPKGYAAIIGNSLGTASTDTLVGQGWVDVEKVGQNVRYRLTSLGSANISPTSKNVIELTNWEKALEVLVALGGRATRSQIHDRLVKEYGTFSMENVRKDLTMLSVNDKGRFAYRAWEVRHGRPKVALDHVYAATGAGANRVYELYDPDIHGQWEVFRSATGALNLRRVKALQDDDLRKQQDQVPEYDPANAAEGKKRLLREIAARQGAPKFRKSLLVAFARTCCISGCNVVEILEAAHIRPYDGPNTNHVTNGLLLRSDLHTLFDLGLIRISSIGMKVVVHPHLHGHGEYAKYDGQKLIESSPAPSKKALAHHWNRNEEKWSVEPA